MCNFNNLILNNSFKYLNKIKKKVVINLKKIFLKKLKIPFFILIIKLKLNL